MDIRKWFSDVSKGFVGGGLLLVIVTIGVPILAWLQSLPWYVIALSAIVAPGFTLFSWNQYKLWQKRRSVQIGHIESVVRNWLYRNSFSIKDDPQSSSVFQFVARDQQNRPVIVCRLKGEPFLTLGARLLVSEKDQQKLDPITGNEDSTLIEDLRIEMARTGVEYVGITHPLRVIDIQKKVSCDDTLTELALLQEAMFIRRIQVLIGEFLSRAMKLSTQTT